MLIDLRMDQCGNIHARPVSRRVRVAIRAHMESMGQPRVATAFFNEGGETARFIEDHLNGRQRAELERRKSVTIQLSAERVSNLFGYDLQL